jgi:hypothetical protein
MEVNSDVISMESIGGEKVESGRKVKSKVREMSETKNGVENRNKKVIHGTESCVAKNREGDKENDIKSGGKLRGEKKSMEKQKKSEESGVLVDSKLERGERKKSVVLKRKVVNEVQCEKRKVGGEALNVKRRTEGCATNDVVEANVGAVVVGESSIARAKVESGSSKKGVVTKVEAIPKDVLQGFANKYVDKTKVLEKCREWSDGELFKRVGNGVHTPSDYARMGVLTKLELQWLDLASSRVS